MHGSVNPSPEMFWGHQFVLAPRSETAYISHRAGLNGLTAFFDGTMPKSYLSVLLFLALLILIPDRPRGADQVPVSGASAAILGAQSTGLSGWSTALTGDPFTLRYNPAGLAHVNRWQAMADFSYLSGKVQGGLGGLALPLQLGADYPGAVGVTAGGVQVARWPVPGLDHGYADQSLWWCQVGYGVAVTKRLSAGVGGKLLWRQITDSNDYLAAYDIGGQYELGANLTLAATATSLAADSWEYMGQDITPPSVWTLGLALNRYRLNDVSDLTATVGLSQHEGDDLTGHLGLQVGYDLREKLRLALRGGVNREGLAAGAGITTSLVEVNYAVSRLPEHDYFDRYAHTLSMSVDFGEVLGRILKSPEVAIAQDRRMQYVQFKASADQAMDEHDYTQAHEDYLKAQAFADSVSQVDSLNRAIGKVRVDMLRQELLEDQELWTQYQDSLDAHDVRWRDSLAVLTATTEARATQLADERDRQRAADYMDDAGELLKQGRYFDALGKLTYVQEIDSGNTQAAGMQELVRSEIRRVLADEMRVQTPQDLLIELDSMFMELLGVDQHVADSVAEAWYQQGINLSRQGRYQQAIEYWERVRKARPQHPTVAEDIATARRRLEGQLQRQEDTTSTP